LALVDSSMSFTSYANLELRLVISEFSLASDTKQELENKHPTNLFRDDECRAFIQQFLYTQQQTVLKTKDADQDRVSIDGSTTEGGFKEYQFLKRTTTEKLAIKAIKGKKQVVEEPVLASAKKVSVKSKTTMDLKKGKVSTKVVK
jgi:hypothetical protein